MHPILFTFPQFIPLLGGRSIHIYGAMIALGFLVGMWWIKRESKRVGIDAQRSTDLAFYVIIAGLVGSRIWYVFDSVPYFWRDPLIFFRVWEGGLVFQGGVVGGVLIAIWLVKKYSMPFFKVSDVFTPALSIGHGLGRMGCFFAGCCHGKPCDPHFPLGITFPDVANAIAPIGVPLYPTQLFEVVGEALIVTFLLTYRKKKSFEGSVFLLYLILYSVLRIIVEFFRGEETRTLVVGTWFSYAQLISVVMIVLAVFCWGYVKKKQKV